MTSVYQKSLFFDSNIVWSTPQWLFDALNREFHFTLDVCANSENAKCESFFSPGVDGLAMPWTGRCWMNPPYNREMKLWVEKAWKESLAGATVVSLLPVRSDCDWWHDFALKGEIRFIRGRLSFGKSLNRAPFASCVVIFSPLCLGSRALSLSVS